MNVNVFCFRGNVPEFFFFFLFQNWDLHILGDVQIDAK